MWIVGALRRTLAYLLQKGQSYKYGIIMKFAVTFVAGIVISLLLTVLWVGYLIFGERDDLWTIEWFFEICWMVTLSLMLFIIAIIMRPNTNSKILA